MITVSTIGGGVIRGWTPSSNPRPSACSRKSPRAVHAPASRPAGLGRHHLSSWDHSDACEVLTYCGLLIIITLYKCKMLPIPNHAGLAHPWVTCVYWTHVHKH